MSAQPPGTATATPQPGDTALVVGLAGALLAWTALPGVHWHDTGEFAAISRLLSISHPPGHPAHAVWTHGFGLLPLGDAALRANLSSAALLALALGALHGLLRALAPGASRLAAVAAALLPALMPAIWLQGVRVEVYALQLLLVVGALRCAAEMSRHPAGAADLRWLVAMALIFGLMGANHSLIGVGLLPVGVAAVILRGRSARGIGAAAVAGLLGLSAYAYLPLRARHGAGVGWGTPDTLVRLWQTISGQAWQKNLTAPPGQIDWFDQIAELGAYPLAQLGPWLGGGLLLVILAGATPLFLSRDRRRLAHGLGLLLAAAGIFATRFFYAFDPLNPDIGGYFAGALVAALAFCWLCAGASRWPRALALVFPATLLLAPLLGPGVDPGLRRRGRSAERLARRMLAEVPVGGALVYSDYASLFLGWAQRALEGRRPDVALVFRGQVAAPWQRDRLSIRRPIWAARLRGFPESYARPSVRFEPGVLLERLGPLVDRLRPVGLTLALAEGWPDRSALAAAWPPLPIDLDGRRSLAFLHLQHAGHAQRVGGGDPGAAALAAWHLEIAEALAPGDPMVASVRAAGLP